MHEINSMCFLYMSCSLLLVGTIVIFSHIDCFVTFVILFWWFWRCVFVGMNCVCSVNINRTHTQSCKHSRTRVFMVVWRSISSVALVTLRFKTVSLSTCYVFLVCVFLSSKYSSVWSHCQYAQIHFLSTLSHFPKNMLDQTISFSQTPDELHCVISTLNDPALLPKIA